MNHFDFNSVEELTEAVQHGKITDLSEEDTIGKVYNVEQIKRIAKRVGPGAFAEVVNVPAVRGIRSCYQRAAALVTHCSNNRKILGKAVLAAEHGHVFNLVSYFGFPRNLGNKSRDYWAWICAQHQWNPKNDEVILLDPFLSPGNNHPRLESLRILKNKVTLVFAQLRILRKASAKTNEFTDMAPVRVPTLVSILFEKNLIEISMPAFAEPILPYHDSSRPQGFPDRSFHAIAQCESELISSRYMPGPLTRLPRNNLMIYLETERGGEDLGWNVERMTGKQGELDTKQRNRIPLKDILSSFTRELAEKCQNGNYVNPLEGKNLYEIFRTLKAESHTVSMDMGVALGPRDGRIELTAFYGDDGAGRTPLYWVMSKFSQKSRRELREAVEQSRALTGLTDPYSITMRFEKK